MNQSKLFSSGLELGNHVASLLSRPWKSISDLYGGINSNHQQRLSDFSLVGKLYKESDSDLTIIAFVTTPRTPISSQNLPPDFVSSVALRENNVPHFEFLCSKNGPPFSVNKTAVDLFCSHHEHLSSLKSQIDRSKPLIVTGHALGGSIATLFTLWLLGDPGPVSARRRNETVSVQPQKRHRTDSRITEHKRPLCITFGSPLIGDQNLQKTISESSIWNSCFLNVASHLDPVPRLFISGPSSSVSNQHNTKNIVYKPLGTFLFSSDRGSACSEDPESILELLKAMDSMNNMNQGTEICDYGPIVKNLREKAICKDSTPLVENITGSLPLQATICLQLRALGFSNNQQLMENLEKRECESQKDIPDPSKKLSQAKIDMANLEWYKKVCKTQRVGYYDSYKKVFSTSDLHVVNFKTSLKIYWKDKIAEAEIKPQTERSAFRKRWLFAGTNYRLMVEPLDIADFYKSGKTDYINQGRPKHYIQLEEWLREDEADSNALNSSKKENAESILTLDSCFWARVEEALLLTQQLASEEFSIPKKDLARSKLIEFEEYVFGLLKNYAVSSEIFLNSSYMEWWYDYKKIVGDSRHSALASFMNNPGNYKQYAKGEFDFP